MYTLLLKIGLFVSFLIVLYVLGFQNSLPWCKDALLVCLLDKMQVKDEGFLLSNAAVTAFICSSKVWFHLSQLTNSLCAGGAASLFSNPGHVSVTPECDMKNVTISSDASYIRAEGKKAIWLQWISILLRSVCSIENTVSFQKMHTFIFERICP